MDRRLTRNDGVSIRKGHDAQAVEDVEQLVRGVGGQAVVGRRGILGACMSACTRGASDACSAHKTHKECIDY